MSSLKFASVQSSEVDSPKFGSYAIFFNSNDNDKCYQKDYLGSIKPFATESIGDLTQLLTTNKSDVVSSINEIFSLLGGSSSGIFGISDGNGSYTYYDSIHDAVSDAVSGQSIEMFCDSQEVTILSPINVVKSLSFNFNGHTFVASGGGYFYVTGGVDVNFNNGKISSGGDGCIVVDANNTVTFGSFWTIGVAGDNLAPIFSSGDIIGARSRTFGGVSAIDTNGGRLMSCYGENLSNNYATCINLGGSTIAQDCHSWTKTGTGMYISGGAHAIGCTAYSASGNAIVCDGFAQDCHGRSDAYSGIALTNNCKAINCSGYSTAYIAVVISTSYASTSFQNIVGYSTANNGISVYLPNPADVKMYGVKAKSTSGIALLVDCRQTSRCIMYDVHAESSGSSPSAHAVRVNRINTATIIFIGGSFSVLDSAAYCLDLQNLASAPVGFSKIAMVGALVHVDPLVVQGLSASEDSFGNILI